MENVGTHPSATASDASADEWVAAASYFEVETVGEGASEASGDGPEAQSWVMTPLVVDALPPASPPVAPLPRAARPALPPPIAEHHEHDDADQGGPNPDAPTTDEVVVDDDDDDDVDSSPPPGTDGDEERGSASVILLEPTAPTASSPAWCGMDPRSPRPPRAARVTPATVLLLCIESPESPESPCANLTAALPTPPGGERGGAKGHPFEVGCICTIA